MKPTSEKEDGVLMVKKSGQVFLFEEEESKIETEEEGMKVCVPVVKRHKPIGAIDVRQWELLKYSWKSIKEICVLMKQDKGKQVCPHWHMTRRARKIIKVAES